MKSKNVYAIMRRSGISNAAGKSNMTMSRLGALTVGLVACLGGVACATVKPYNPYNLEGGRVAQIQALCESTMGLNPATYLDTAQWPGNPDPNFNATNPYRSCVAALSQALLRIYTAQHATEVGKVCRAKGYPEGSGELATCVLGGVQSDPVVVPAKQSASGVVASTVTVPRDLQHREQYVCAQIGIEPTGEQFSRCVQGLNNAVIARDMDQNYRN